MTEATETLKRTDNSEDGNNKKIKLDTSSTIVDVKTEEVTADKMAMDNAIETETVTVDSKVEGQENSSEALKQETSTTTDKMEVENVEAKIKSENNEKATCSSTPKEESVNRPLRRGEEGFTSEIYKIRVDGFKKLVGVGQLKQWAKKLKITPIKLVKSPKWTHCFMTFGGEEEKEAAKIILSNAKFKNKQIFVRDAEAKKFQERAETYLKTDVDFKDQLNNKLCSLWKLPYEEQIKTKTEKTNEYMKNLAYTLHYDGDITEKGDAMIKSPIVDGYRNKCEFACGLDGNVGFFLGKTEKGVVIMPPDNCPHISDLMKKITTLFSEYITKSKYTGYDSLSMEGFYRQIVVRTTSKNEVMILVQMHPQSLTEDEIDAEKKSIGEFFKSLKNEHEIDLHCGFFQKYSQRTVGLFEKDPIEILFGDSPYIYETLLGLTFRISITSFFQINAPTAELLYSLIRDWCSTSLDNVVLDVCCGTGTIGLSMAKSVEKVYGLEIVESAIADAKLNAARNEISNVEYECGKAEFTLPAVLKKNQNKQCVGVVDPPRNGLHHSVVKALRSSPLKKLIYVSCDPKQAQNNLINLCQDVGGKSEPFKIKKYCAVDLFPHTPGYELVLLLERDGPETPEPNSKPKPETETEMKPEIIEPKLETTEMKPEIVEPKVETTEIKPEIVEPKLETTTEMKPEIVEPKLETTEMKPTEVVNETAEN